MPYSAIFQGYIRITTTPLLSMSLRPTATTYFRVPKSLRPSLLPFFTRNRPPLLRNSHVRPYSRARVTCSAVEVDRRVRQRRVARPLWDQQSSSYGRFAYQDVSSDESDRELGPAQQQSVSFRLPHFVEFGFCVLVYCILSSLAMLGWAFQVFIRFWNSEFS
jgi:ATP-dependent RNA helicase DHX36